MSHHAPMCANPGTAPSVVNPGRASYPKAEFLQSHSTCPSNVCHVDRRRGHRMSELPGLHCPHAMCRGFFTHIVSCACTDVAQLSVSAIPYIYPTYTLHIPYIYPTCSLFFVRITPMRCTAFPYVVPVSRSVSCCGGVKLAEQVLQRSTLSISCLSRPVGTMSSSLVYSGETQFVAVRGPVPGVFGPLPHSVWNVRLSVCPVAVHVCPVWMVQCNFLAGRVLGTDSSACATKDAGVKRALCRVTRILCRCPTCTLHVHRMSPRSTNN